MKINEKANKKLYVIISSTLGLCGSYNSNIFKVSDAKITKDDDAIILGQKGISRYSKGEFKVISGFEENAAITDKAFVNKIKDYILKEYIKGTYSEIHIIYSEYKNSLVFLAKDYKLLPFVNNKEESNDYPQVHQDLVQILVDSHCSLLCY